MSLPPPANPAHGSHGTGATAAAHRARILRLAASIGLLAGVLYWLDPRALGAAFSAPHPGWLAAALALGVPQVVLSAWRWRLTAARLGAHLPLGAAVREYYLATFLNQVLPGGVMGDAARAWRHARKESHFQRGGAAAWQAVVLERASGQLALLLVVLASLALSPALRSAVHGAFSGPSHTEATLAGLLLALLALGLTLSRTRLRVHLSQLRQAARQALLARGAFLPQLIASLLVVASYVGVYLCCMRMIGIDTPLATAAPLIPWVLLAMAIPLSIAGWGVREGAAALLWQAAGLDPAQGVAISISYGAVVLLSSLPGALMLRHGRAVAVPDPG